MRDYKVTYVAGGAAQNAARGAAVRVLYRIQSRMQSDHGVNLVHPPPKIRRVHRMRRRR